MTCLVQDEAYEKLPVTAHSKEAFSCHIVPSEGQIQHFTAEHNLNVLREGSFNKLKHINGGLGYFRETQFIQIEERFYRKWFKTIHLISFS